jgi:FMN phosphatase YigB (HAD superfamily)
VVSALARDRQRIVLQIHDLAEDGRPANHSLISGVTELYPFSSRIHYAFLNSRDRQVFLEAGLPESMASLVVNPITPTTSPGQTHSGSPLVFAPIRAIRRKNIGELVLLSALAPEGARFAISRAPLDPDAKFIHEKWKRFADCERLPIRFDVSDRIPPHPDAGSDFLSWVKHSTHWVTTSISEGFGLPFLESIAHQKPLLGRSIPSLMEDHLKHGLRLGDLYDQLLIPAEWVDLTILKDHLVTTLERSYRAYQRPINREISETAFDSLVHGDWLDFGNLPEPLQQGAIERILEPGCRKIPQVNIRGVRNHAWEWLGNALENRRPHASPDQLAPWSATATLEKISSIYQKLAAAPADGIGFVDSRQILARFLRPSSFHFLKSSPKPSENPFPYRAVVFDIYGTLLIAPGGGVKPDPDADPELRRIIRDRGFSPPASPSAAIHAAVLRHHAATRSAGNEYPEVDLRKLWREVLLLDEDTSTQGLVEAIEEAWHPAVPMPGAAEAIAYLSAAGVSLGLLSNAQCNTLPSLGSIAAPFAPELTILSFQHGIAKPSPRIFAMLAERLAGRGILPKETLYIGNDPLHDILPASACGFATALFKGHPDSLRAGKCEPDHVIEAWTQIRSLTRAD